MGLSITFTSTTTCIYPLKIIKVNFFNKLILVSNEPKTFI